MWSRTIQVWFCLFHFLIKHKAHHTYSPWFPTITIPLPYTTSHVGGSGASSVRLTTDSHSLSPPPFQPPLSCHLNNGTDECSHCYSMSSLQYLIVLPFSIDRAGGRCAQLHDMLENEIWWNTSMQRYQAMNVPKRPLDEVHSSPQHFLVPSGLWSTPWPSEEPTLSITNNLFSCYGLQIIVRHGRQGPICR